MPAIGAVGEDIREPGRRGDADKQHLHPVQRARKLCEVISVITVSQCRTWNAESSPPSLHFSTLAFADRHVLFCFVS